MVAGPQGVLGDLQMRLADQEVRLDAARAGPDRGGGQRAEQAGAAAGLVMLSQGPVVGGHRETHLSHLPEDRGHGVAVEPEGRRLVRDETDHVLGPDVNVGTLELSIPHDRAERSKSVLARRQFGDRMEQGVSRQLAGTTFAVSLDAARDTP